VLGYGLVTVDEEDIRAVESGVVTAPRSLDRVQRLLRMHVHLNELLDRLTPHEVAVEEPFVGKNVNSALAIGEARGVVLVAAAVRGIPVFQYPPATIKSAVSGYGRGDKEQVRRMVSLQLGLAEPPASTDASDALAIALCHVVQTRAQRILRAST
jgi:crossover junction endodeoxyribonuclease RuvC